MPGRQVRGPAGRPPRCIPQAARSDVLSEFVSFAGSGGTPTCAATSKQRTHKRCEVERPAPDAPRASTSPTSGEVPWRGRCVCTVRTQRRLTTPVASRSFFYTGAPPRFSPLAQDERDFNTRRAECADARGRDQRDDRPVSKVPQGHGPGRRHTAPDFARAGAAHLSLRRVQSDQDVYSAGGPPSGPRRRERRIRDRTTVPRGVEPDNRRREPRHALATPATLYGKDGSFLFPCTIRDLSKSGGRLELFKEAVLPQYFLLSMLPDGGGRRLCSKVWQLALVAGVRFVERQSA